MPNGHMISCRGRTSYHAERLYLRVSESCTRHARTYARAGTHHAHRQPRTCMCEQAAERTTARRCRMVMPSRAIPHCAGGDVRGGRRRQSAVGSESTPPAMGHSSVSCPFVGGFESRLAIGVNSPGIPRVAQGLVLPGRTVLRAVRARRSAGWKAHRPHTREPNGDLPGVRSHRRSRSGRSI